MNALVIAGLVVAGAIHLLPLVGLSGPERVQTLYDVRIDDLNLGVLMTHRAALFGLLGGFLVYAVFDHDARWPAIVAGAVSAASFIVIAHRASGVNAALRKVVVADWVALAALAAAAAGQSRL